MLFVSNRTIVITDIIIMENIRLSKILMCDYKSSYQKCNGVDDAGKVVKIGNLIVASDMKF